MLEILFKMREDYGLTDKQMVEIVNNIYDYSTKLAKVKVVSEDCDYELLAALVGLDKKDRPILTEEKYKSLTDDAKMYLIEDYFLTEKEMKFKSNEDAVKYYINKARK